jgi:hypothetical protein
LRDCREARRREPIGRSFLGGFSPIFFKFFLNFKQSFKFYIFRTFFCRFKSIIRFFLEFLIFFDLLGFLDFNDFI